MTTARRRPSLRIAADKRGSTGIMFGLLLMPAVFMLGICIDYSRTVTVKRQLQSAADAALTAGVAAAAYGASTTNAQTTASNVWSSNVAQIAGGQTSVPAPLISISNTNGLVSGQLNYSATQKTTFAGLMRQSNISLSGQVGAQASVTTTRTNASSGLSGSAGAVADPHIWGPDSSGWAMSCPTGNWYNLLSDTSIEVNVYCIEPGADAEFINKFAVVLGDQTFMISIPEWNWTGGNDQFGGTWVPGQVYVNGSPENLTYGQTTTLYSGTYGTVTYAYMSKDFNNMDSNVLTVTTPVYTMTMNFPHAVMGSGRSAYNQQNGGMFNVTATGAGTCGTIGGEVGQTFDTAADDINAADFKVASAYATQTTFNNACSTTVTVIKGVHLTQ